MAYKNKDDAKLYYREYYLKNKDKKQKQKHALYLKNKETILKNLKDSYIPHPKVLKTEEEKHKTYLLRRSKNKDSYNAYMRNWNKENRERLLPTRKDYYHTRLSVNVRYQRLYATAKARNHECNISKDEFIRIVSLPCAYCGENEKRIGIDRVNNEIGYTPENSNPCCKTCNYMKKGLTVQEFKEHIQKIHNYYPLNTT